MRVGEVVTVTAVPDGGTAPLQYAYDRYQAATGTWAWASAWSPMPTLTWTPAPGEAGPWTVRAHSADRVDVGSADTNTVWVAGTVETAHLDAVGSVRAVTDERGQVLRRHDVEPFGEEWQAPIPPPDARLFTGQERDAETALDYFGARYYRADLGRFTTVDPELNMKDALVDPQRWNRYAYVTNNPLKYTDPDGKNPLLITGGIGAAVYGGWAIYQNVSRGQPWYNNVGVEATKGLLVGVTLGAAASALATTELALASGAAAAGRAGTSFATGQLLLDHFAKHGTEFGARTAQEYLAGASQFAEAALQGTKGVEMAVRTNGDKLFYKVATNEFLVITANGVIRTYFKPTRGVECWIQQVATGSK